MTDYASPFDFKAEAKKIKELTKTNGKEWGEKEMSKLNAHADMLRKMSAFVNAKNKNGMIKRN